MTAPWEPVLEGRLAEHGWEAIREIARALAAGGGVRRDPADRLLFWSYLAGAIDEDWVIEQHEQATTELVVALDAGVSRPALFGGLAELGWVLAHVSGDGAADEVLEVIDARFERELAVERWPGHFDLISGLTGVGVYFAERPLETARRALVRIIDHLVTMSEPVGSNTTWFTHPDLMVGPDRARYPGGYFNCGLAHGAPGVIALLDRLAPLGDSRIAPLAAAATRWLLGQQQPPHAGGRFGTAVTRDRVIDPHTRTAWCYGDPGVALALWRREPAVARELALACATREPDRCGVVDAGLCHGAVGLAHMLARFHHASPDPRLRDAAVSWYERALAMRRADGIAGFPAWSALEGDETSRWIASESLLDGAIGVGLALLAAVHPVEPRWDRKLLCDMPIA